MKIMFSFKPRAKDPVPVETTADSCVYVHDEGSGWLPAKVVSQNDDTEATVKVYDMDGTTLLEVRRVNLSGYPNKALPLQNVNAAGKLQPMPDMVDLPSLHEAAILYNLRARHVQGKPYTRVGDLMIAVNPFRWMKELYTEQVRNQYTEQLIWNTHTVSPDDAKSQLAPHVYETSSLAYRGLAVDGQNQSILVSGESGAGKTETVKIVLNHLASVENGRDPTTTMQKEKTTFPQHHLVVQRVLDSNPLLEAFGNAKTVRNDNSSRFGKFVQFKFDVNGYSTEFRGKDVPCYRLAGSEIETYLLEKSRVVGHEVSERTYHIFYQLLAATDSTKEQFWKGLVGKTNASFRYVGETDTMEIDGKSDRQQLELTLQASEVLGFTGEKLTTLMRAVCTVMQLGNIVMEEDPRDCDVCEITSLDELSLLSDLMGISMDDLKDALTYRTMTTGRGDTYAVPLRVDDARDACGAFAKEIYQRVFDWLVREVNSATSVEIKDSDVSDKYGLIGLLDIYGFESFQTNRFEQLCINYTNEKLQQKYTLDTFQSVQEEYEYEGLNMGTLVFEDNTDVLWLIEGRMGLISILNEECVRPKGNDKSFVSKMKAVNLDSTCLVHDDLHRPTEFGIHHYAGVVTYDASSFIQKNTDALLTDLVECSRKSSNTLIQREFMGGAISKANVRAGNLRRTTSKLTHTVAAKFKSQLGHLMQNIGKTQTRYIRCIQPNQQKAPFKMNMLSTVEQLRCAGVVAAVTVSRMAFPNRLSHEAVLKRYMCLSSLRVRWDGEEKKEETPGDGVGCRSAANSLLIEVMKDFEVQGEDCSSPAFECGRSRIYFRTGAREHLEGKRFIKLTVSATAIQRVVRGFTTRSMYGKLMDVAILCQANARRTFARNRFRRAKVASLRLSCWFRCTIAKVHLARRRRARAAVRIQSIWRMLNCVTLFKSYRSAATTIQRISRRAVQNHEQRTALKPSRESFCTNDKLDVLRKRLREAERKLILSNKQRVEAEKRLDRQGRFISCALRAPAVVTEDESSEEVPGSDEEHGLARSASSDGSSQRSSDSFLFSQHSNNISAGTNERLMLEFFKKEVFKLRSENYALRRELADVGEENDELSRRSESFNMVQNRMSTTMQDYLKLTVKSARQKETIVQMKTEALKTKFRHVSELKKIKKDRDTEVNLLREEIEQLRRSETRDASEKGADKWKMDGDTKSEMPGQVEGSSSKTLTSSEELRRSLEFFGSEEEKSDHKEGNVGLRRSDMWRLSERKKKETKARRALKMLHLVEASIKEGRGTANEQRLLLLQCYDCVLETLSNGEDSLNEAQEIFDRMKKLQRTTRNATLPDTLSYSNAILALSKCGTNQEAAHRTNELLEEAERRCKKGSAKEAERVTYNNVVSDSSRTGNEAVSHAHELLQQSVEGFKRGKLQEPELVSFSDVLCAWSRMGRPEKAQEVLLLLDVTQQEFKGLVFDVSIYNTVLRAHIKYSREDALRHSVALVQHMEGRCHENPAIRPDRFTYNALIMAWLQSDRPDALENAELLLLKMERLSAKGHYSTRPTTQDYNIVFDAYTKSISSSTHSKALTLLQRMQKSSHVQPDLNSFTSIIECLCNCTEQNASTMAHDLFKQAYKNYEKSGDELQIPTLRIFTLTIMALAKCPQRLESMARARNLLVQLNEMYASTGLHSLKPNIYPFKYVLECATKFNGTGQEKMAAFQAASQTYQEMRSNKNVVVDSSIYALWISVCNNLLPTKSSLHSKCVTLACQQCKQEGLLSAEVLIPLKSGTAQDTLCSLLELQNGSGCEQVRVQDLPRAWTRKTRL